MKHRGLCVCRVSGLPRRPVQNVNRLRGGGGGCKGVERSLTLAFSPFWYEGRCEDVDVSAVHHNLIGGLRHLGEHSQHTQYNSHTHTHTLSTTLDPCSVAHPNRQHHHRPFHFPETLFAFCLFLVYKYTTPSVGANPIKTCAKLRGKNIQALS